MIWVVNEKWPMIKQCEQLSKHCSGCLRYRTNRKIDKNSHLAVNEVCLSNRQTNQNGNVMPSLLLLPTEVRAFSLVKICY